MTRRGGQNFRNRLGQNFWNPHGAARRIVWYTGDLADILAAGLELAWNDIHKPTRHPVATGWISPTRLTELVAVAHVTRVEKTMPLEPELNTSVPAIGVKALRAAHPAITGAGVIVAVVDGGFDWTHGSFRDDATGRTRILAIWDHMLGPRRPGEIGFSARLFSDPTQRSPVLGVLYDRDDIDHSLGFSVNKPQPVQVRTTDPPGRVDRRNNRDIPHGHGTHVSGIAVGDGSPKPCCRPWGAGRYQGVAPGADIILVRASPDEIIFPMVLSFIDEFSGAKPVVVNLSAGRNDGPHDGRSLAEQSIDQFVAKPGRIFVKSAGNEGNTKKHARFTVPAQAGQPPAPGVVEPAAGLRATRRSASGRGRASSPHVAPQTTAPQTSPHHDTHTCSPGLLRTDHLSSRTNRNNESTIRFSELRRFLAERVKHRQPVIPSGSDSPRSSRRSPPSPGPHSATGVFTRAGQQRSFAAALR